MQLANAIAEVLHEAVSETDQLAQFLGSAVRQAGDRRTLLRREPSDPERVDGVGLRPLQVLSGKPPRPERVEQCHVVTSGRESGEQVLPVVARRLHGDKHVSRPAQQGEQLFVPGGVLGEARRLNHGIAGFVYDRNEVRLGCDVDPREAHKCAPLGRGSPGASEPVPMLSLVDARTPTAPLDTVRAKDTGRGRQSHLRGLLPRPGYDDPLP